MGGAGVFSSLGVSGSAGFKDLGVGDSATLGENSSDKLTVNSTASFTSPVSVSNTLTTTGSISTGGNLTVTGAISAGPLNVSATSSSSILSVTQSGTGNIVEFFDATNTVFVIKDGGNVGIGTTTPAYKLQIAGDIVPTANNLYSLGTSSLKWSNIYTATTTVGDLAFANDFRFVETEALTSPQALILKNQRGEEIMRIDEQGNLLIPGQLSSGSQTTSSQTTNPLINLVQEVKQALASLGFYIENGIAQLKELLAEKITTKKLCVEDVCVDRNQLKELLDKNQISTTPTPTFESAPTPTAEPAPPAEPTPTAEITSTAASTATEAAPTPSATSSITEEMGTSAAQ